MVKKKELTKKEKKKIQVEIKVTLLQDQLDNLKRVRDKYLQVLIKYDMKNIAYAAIMADELQTLELNRLLKYSEKGKKYQKVIMEFMFGNPKQTEEEKLEEAIKDRENDIQIIQNKIEMFDNETKRKIAKDSVLKMALYFKIGTKNSEIAKELIEDKKPEVKNNEL